jgi:hypothetical protein
MDRLSSLTGACPMKRHDLIDVLTTHPFRPFRMYVTDGATYLIRHPNLVLVSPTTVIVGAAEGHQAGPAIERFNMIGLDHITRLEQVEQTPTST